MRAFLAALVGALAGSAVIVAVAVAVPDTGYQATSASQMPMGGSMGAMMNAPASAAATRKLMIRHVQNGCHVWSDGKKTASTMRVHLMRGQHLAIMDMDIDAHQMMQLSGPTHMRMGGPMTMNHGMTLTFSKAGVYRFRTKTVEMPGAMEVETTGPDNQLRLVVTVR